MESLTTVSAYEILGLPEDAPQRDIHSALRRLALAWHPDRVPAQRRGEATLRFQSIMDAYNKVRTPESRKAYDDAMAATLRARRYTPVKSVTPGRPAPVRADNDNLPLGTRARAWLKAIETVFWPIRKTK